MRALSIAVAALPTLVKLIDGSLLVVEGNDGLSPRSRLHELLRQIALGRFEETLASPAAPIIRGLAAGAVQ